MFSWLLPEYRGANGEGKSTFMNIVTGKLMPDEGKVEWSKNVRVGYLDQTASLEKGMTIESVLKSAFSWLFEMEERMNDICNKLGEADPDQMDAMMEELGTIQDMLDSHDFYIIDSKVEEVARAWTFRLRFRPRCNRFKWWTAYEGTSCKTLIRETRHPSFGRAYELLRRRTHHMVKTLLTGI